MTYRVDMAHGTPSGRNVIVQVEAEGGAPISYADLLTAVRAVLRAFKYGVLWNIER